MTVVGDLSVLPAYEAEALGVLDLRRDWTVRRLLVVRRALVPVPGRSREHTVGAVLRTEEIEQMRRWADDDGQAHISYLLDLAPD